MSNGHLSRRVFLAAAVAIGLTPAQAFAVTQKASEVVAQAAASADASGKTLLLVFHASWCGYCTLLDMMLEDPACAAILDKYFVVYHLRALERKPEMKAQQLDGADGVYESLTPAKTGLPYMAVLNGKAERVSDSIMPLGDNFGFPVEAVELDNFQDMMRKGAPGMTVEESRKLRATCVRIFKRHS